MLTGDNRTTALAVGRALGIDEIEADVLPEDKAGIVKRFQAAGESVAMAAHPSGHLLAAGSAGQHHARLGHDEGR
jgi:high-affinity K+ transport system ATPase subunit B